VAKRQPITDLELRGMSLPPKTLGASFKAKRVALKLSRHEVARRIHVSPKTIQQWELGNLDPLAVRLINWILEGDSDVTEMWRRRALLAEAALKDITVALREFRETARSEANELREPGVGASSRDSSSQPVGRPARVA
jgi:transcriptional regulator with XRE-family HTH domain